MKYKISFLLVVLGSFIFGIFISVINNNIIIESNNDKEYGKTDIKKDNTEQYPTKNKSEEHKNNTIKDDDKMKNKNSTKNETDVKENKNKTDTKIITKKDNITKSENITKKDNITKKENVTKKDDITKKEDIKNKTIHLAIGLDAKYALPGLVYLQSLAENKLKDTIYEIHIMISDNFEQKHKDIINSVYSIVSKEEFIIHFIDMKNSYNHVTTDSHSSKAQYYRINLPTILPHLDKIIYSDTDVVNFEDLTSLYNLDFKDKIYFRGFLDYYFIIETMRKYGVYTTKYMNSGIMLMNLKGIREDGIQKKIQDFVAKHPKLEHQDQTAINAICNDNFEKFHLKYNFFNMPTFEHVKRYNLAQDKRYRYTDQEIYEAFHSPVNLHYAGWEKPWIKEKVCPFREYWWYYAKRTKYYKEILEQYRVTEDYVERLLKNIPSTGSYIRPPKNEKL